MPASIGIGFDISSGGAAPFTPDSISGLEVWLESDFGTSTTTPDAAVSSWNSKTPATVNFTQGTGANQPLFKSNIFNGKAALLFDGSNDNLAGTVAANTPHTIFMVLKWNSVVNASRAFGYTAESSLCTISGAYSWFSTEGGGISTIGGTTTNAAIITLKIASAASMSSYLNGGAAAATFDPHNLVTTATSINIGTEDSASNPANVYVAAFLRYTSALSSANQTLVQNYLGSKYGITVTSS
jgi:hypothetical protein